MHHCSRQGQQPAVHFQGWTKPMWPTIEATLAKIKTYNGEVNENGCTMSNRTLTAVVLNNRSLTDDRGDLQTAMVGKKKLLDSLLKLQVQFYLHSGSKLYVSARQCVFIAHPWQVEWFFFLLQLKKKPTQNRKQNVYVFVRCSHTFWNAKEIIPQ